ncbi:MAG: glycosyltransferase family 39 protein [Nitratireductor sp.]|nr:glycosyltransferase family 39 protein [Nitratireductor sp.]
MADTQSDTSAPAGRSMRLFVVMALGILALRIVALRMNNSELFFDEAQYWLWGREPDFGYFSKPPLLGWILAAFTGLCGNGEFCVRLPSAILHTLTAFALYLTAATLFDRRTAFVAGALWLLLPAVSLSATLISTDAPLLACWSLGMLALARYRREGGAVWLLLLALAFGLGLNAKYAMVYFLLCFVLYGACVRQGRAMLADGRIWAAFAIGFAFLVPNILWQMDHQFTTVTHTGDNIGWRGEFPNFTGLLEFLGSQFGVAGPVVFAVYLIALFRLWREGASETQKGLIAFSLPILALVCFQAVMSKAYANWAATAFPAVVLLTADLFVHRMPAFWLRLSNGIHLVVFAALLVLPAFALPGQLPVADRANPFARLWGGRDLAVEIAAAADQAGAAGVLSDSRKRSATLTYYLRDTPLRLYAWRRGAAPGDHYELTRALQDQPPEALAGRKFVLPVTGTTIPADIASAFDTVSEIRSVPDYPGSRDTIRLYLLEGYHGG